MTRPAMILPPDSGRSQIPHGVQDRFLVEAARRRQAEAAVRQCFSSWGYQEVIPPTYEYYDNLAVGASGKLRQTMYRFFDQQGRTLALRADFTPQIARMAATKLFDQPMPLRCSYVGSLFRHEEPQAGRKREFTQAGVELIGADTPAADAEVVALAVAAMETLQLENFQINLGQMGFFRALTAEFPYEALSQIRDAIDHKDTERLGITLAEAGVVGRQHELLSRLPDLVGTGQVLDEARALSEGLPSGPAAIAALDRLEETYSLLHAYGASEAVILDLSEVRGMDYYTGITFRGVAQGLGWPVVSGGRYDDLIVDFGRPMPAVGFGLGIERALLVQSKQLAPTPSISPHLLVRGCAHRGCLALVGQLRQMGCQVETDVLGLADAGLADYAGQRGITQTLRCTESGYLLSGMGGERALTEAELLSEAKSWIT
ncbi:ATP phosphoribosyltransferase regulatory subunit [Chloroflexota bacterium]